jgi:hypothetical protein
MDDASAAVGELLVALRRRRRWMLVVALAPLATAGAAVAAMEARFDELALPIGVAGAAVTLAAVIGAIEAGLAANRAMRSVARVLPVKPGT